MFFNVQGLANIFPIFKNPPYVVQQISNVYQCIKFTTIYRGSLYSLTFANKFQCIIPFQHIVAPTQYNRFPTYTNLQESVQHI